MATALRSGTARTLTVRQAEFLSLIEEGLTHQQIADRFGISSRTVTSVVYGVLNRASDGCLTQRQLECLVLVAQGKSDTQIAAQLYLSPHTVRKTLKDARGRMNAKTSPHCLVLAIAQELLILDHNGVVSIPVELMAA